MAPRGFACFGPFRFRERAGIHVREQVFGGKLVRAGELPLQIRHQFTGTQSGTFLNADAVGVEEHQIRSDDATPGGLPFLQHIKPVCACVLLLVETQVPDFHSAPPSNRAA
jgi:hypothetical protein